MKLLIFMLFFPLSAFSSHVVHCILEGTLESRNKSDVIIKVVKSKKLKMSYVDCQEFVGKSKTLKLTNNRINGKKEKQLQKSIKINYLYMDSMGPKGVVKNTTWFYEVKIK
jgi:hypothetical protein